MGVVHTIWNADKDQRVDIFQREDGTFGFEELRYATEGQAWRPFGRYCESFKETLEAAIFEASSRVQWVTPHIEES